MIDKEKYTLFISDLDTKKFIIKNISKLEGVLYHFDIRKTDFMNPYEQSLFSSILNSFSDELSYIIDGGNDLCERKLFIIFPSFLDKKQVFSPLKLLRIKGNFKFEKINHRDCLGSLMSLGISREKIGDIFISETFIDVVIDENFSNYITSNFNSIKHTSIKTEILDINKLAIAPNHFKTINIGVSSLRLDAIISEIFNVSRNASTNLIKNNKVKVNYEPIINSSKELSENSLISVKGYGRALFSNTTGKSKKGNYRLNINIYE